MKFKKIEVYEATDGTQFDTEEKCLKHEVAIVIKQWAKHAFSGNEGERYYDEQIADQLIDGWNELELQINKVYQQKV